MAKPTVKMTITLASKIADGIVAAADEGKAVRSLMESMMQQFRGFPAELLGETDTAMVDDALKRAYAHHNPATAKAYKARDLKVARCMPLLLRMEAKQFSKVSKSYRFLAGFCTRVQKLESTSEALKALAAETNKAPDYKKSAAVHLKSLRNLKDGTFWSAKQKAAIDACAEALGLVI